MRTKVLVAFVLLIIPAIQEGKREETACLYDIIVYNNIENLNLWRRKMNWIDEVSLKLKKKNQVLFSKSSEYMQDLIKLFEIQNHRVMALWAFDFASESIAKFEEKYPEEKRPREALEKAKDWASGKIKMHLAQRKILDCHAVTKEMENKEDIAICHSIGQACAVVHTARHAIGYALYDLSLIHISEPTRP